jgi:predicted MFS family arabinose efflux permease
MLLTEAGLAAGVISMLLGGISLEKLGVGPTLVVCEALVAAGVLIVWLGVRKGKRTA